MKTVPHVFIWDDWSNGAGLKESYIDGKPLYKACCTITGDAYAYKAPNREKITHGFKTVEDAKAWCENQIRNWMGLDGQDRI